MEITDIKILRKQHNLTQLQLAKLSGVSQSLIAKIESGRIDPAFTKVKRILETLNSLSERKEKKAAELMTKKMVTAKKDELLSIAAKKMKSNEISQMPVVEKDNVVGLLTESVVVDAIATNKDITKTTVDEVMLDSPPIISGKMPKSAVIGLLRFSPIIIVKENGKIKGVITKSDVIAS